MTTKEQQEAAKAAEAKLSALTAPVADEEEREALEYFQNRDGGHSYLTAGVHGLVLARALRSKTQALKEAEAKIESYQGDACEECLEARDKWRDRTHEAEARLAALQNEASAYLLGREDERLEGMEKKS